MPEIELTMINWIGATVLVLMSAMTILLPRQHALLPLIVTAAFMTDGQTVILSGLHFTPLRVLILSGFLRVLVRGEISAIRFGNMDKILLWFVLVSSVAYLYLYRRSGAFTYRLGIAYTIVGMYFYLRTVVTDLDDVESGIRYLALIVIPLSVFFIVEKMTGRNVFSVLGGVPEITVIRDGALRCQGPFRHPILAGTFSATMMPLLFSLRFFSERDKWLSNLGLISCTVITVTCASSGPILALIFGIAALAMWPCREKMRVVRWLLLVSVLFLHIVMKAPVWYLIARISEVIGGTGYHRAELINQAIEHFDEWWLTGTTHTAHWMPYVLPDFPDMVDITNEYILVGVNGGVLSLALFLAIIVTGFREVGKSVREFENVSFRQSILNWCIGATLLAHATAFLSVTYFDQIFMFWYLVLAFVVAAKPPWKEKETEEEEPSLFVPTEGLDPSPSSDTRYGGSDRRHPPLPIGRSAE